ncbi:hypothetical protein ABW19_dt0204255 [Dactylella cylindrospora]|nr:hypothetical protein ABW19_dt0204255 [Dactylella cylindrospora]
MELVEGTDEWDELFGTARLQEGDVLDWDQDRWRVFPNRIDMVDVPTQANPHPEVHKWYGTSRGRRPTQEQQRDFQRTYYPMYPPTFDSVQEASAGLPSGGLRSSHLIPQWEGEGNARGMDSQGNLNSAIKELKRTKPMEWKPGSDTDRSRVPTSEIFARVDESEFQMNDIADSETRSPLLIPSEQGAKPGLGQFKTTHATPPRSDNRAPPSQFKQPRLTDLIPANLRNKATGPNNLKVPKSPKPRLLPLSTHSIRDPEAETGGPEQIFITSQLQTMISDKPELLKLTPQRIRASSNNPNIPQIGLRTSSSEEAEVPDERLADEGRLDVADRSFARVLAPLGSLLRSEQTGTQSPQQGTNTNQFQNFMNIINNNLKNNPDRESSPQRGGARVFDDTMDFYSDDASPNSGDEEKKDDNSNGNGRYMRFKV